MLAQERFISDSASASGMTAGCTSEPVYANVRVPGIEPSNLYRPSSSDYVRL